MKRYLVCISILALLSGCSSAGKLRNSAPTAVYVGDASAEDVVSCVSSAWATKQFQISTVPVVGSTSIQLQDSADGPVVALVDIAKTGATTTAKYYSQMSIDDTWFFEQVKGCM